MPSSSNNNYTPMQIGSPPLLDAAKPVSDRATPLRVAISDKGLEPICVGGEDYYEWLDRAAYRLGIHSEDLVNYILGIISRCNPNVNTETANAMLAAVVEAEPKDPQELLLLCQMTAVNNMAMDALSDAVKTRSSKEKERNLAIAGKLMSLYNHQMDTLHRYRKVVSPMQVISNNAVIGNVYGSNN